MTNALGGMGTGHVHGTAPTLAPKTPDQTLQDAQTKVANRGLGGKIVAWLRNQGAVKTQSPTMQAVRQAITSKVGADSSQAIFDHLKLGANKSLTNRQITAAINLANRVEAGQSTPLGQAFLNLPAPNTTTTPAARFATALIGVEKAMAASGVDRGHLTDHELVALWDYSADGYSHLNNELRAGNPNGDVQAYATTLNTALGKLPDHPGPVFRAVNLPANVLGTYTQGATVTEHAFSSTSKAEGEAKMFPSNHFMYIDSSHGKDISGFSRSPGEQEVLFPAGTQFRILTRENQVDMMAMAMGGPTKANFTMQEV